MSENEVKVSGNCPLCGRSFSWEDTPKDEQTFEEDCPHEECGAHLRFTYLVLPGSNNVMVHIEPA